MTAVAIDRGLESAARRHLIVAVDLQRAFPNLEFPRHGRKAWHREGPGTLLERVDKAAERIRKAAGPLENERIGSAAAVDAAIHRRRTDEMQSIVARAQLDTARRNGAVAENHRIIAVARTYGNTVARDILHNLRHRDCAVVHDGIVAASSIDADCSATLG